MQGNPRIESFNELRRRSASLGQLTSPFQTLGNHCPHECFHILTDGCSMTAKRVLNLDGKMDTDIHSGRPHLRDVTSATADDFNIPELTSHKKFRAATPDPFPERPPDKPPDLNDLFLEILPEANNSNSALDRRDLPLILIRVPANSPPGRHESQSHEQ